MPSCTRSSGIGMTTVSRNEIVSYWYNSREVQDCLRKMHRPDVWEDIRQDIFEALLRQDEAELVEMHLSGRLRFFIVRFIINLTYHTRNAITRQYSLTSELSENHTDTPDPDHDSAMMEAWHNKAMQAIDGLHWYYKGILDLYTKLGSVRAVSEQTGIPFSSIKLAISTLRKQVKQEVAA